VRSERRDHQSSHTDPVFDQVCMHPDVGGHFSVPITGALQLVETELQSILEGRSSADKSDMIRDYDRMQLTRHNDFW
jgi:hypothetical protein